MKKITVEKYVEVQKDKLHKLPFSVMHEFKNGAAIIMKTGNYGALREDGVVIVKPEYDSFDRDFKDGIAVFQNNAGFNNKYQVLIDKSGKVIKELFNMDYVPFDDNSLAIISGSRKNSLSGMKCTYYELIDRNGNNIVKPQDKYLIYGIYKDKAIMEKIVKPSKRYIVDETGVKHKFFDYDAVEIIGDNLIHVEKSGIHFLTDIYNNKVSRDYDSFTYGKGMINATLGDKKYVIDSLGNEKKCYDMSSVKEVEELFEDINSYYSDIKKEKDSSLNTCKPNDYKTLIMSNIKKCLSSGYKTPLINASDEVVVVDYMYACKSCDLKFKYILKICKFDNEVIIKEFDSKDECDKYYDELMKEIDKCNINTQNQIDKVYKDANDSLDMFLDKLKVKK